MRDKRQLIEILDKSEKKIIFFMIIGKLQKRQMFFVAFSGRTETNARRARSASHVRGEKRKTV